MNQKGNKIAAKNKAYHEKEHRKMFRKARTKVKKLPIRNRAKRASIIADLEEANGDLMHLLATPESFIDSHGLEGYIQTIDAYLAFEVLGQTETCIELKIEKTNYPKPMKYEVGKMKELMEEIRGFNNRLDKYQQLKDKISVL